MNDATRKLIERVGEELLTLAAKVDKAIDAEAKLDNKAEELNELYSKLINLSADCDDLAYEL